MINDKRNPLHIEKIKPDERKKKMKRKTNDEDETNVEQGLLFVFVLRIYEL